MIEFFQASWPLWWMVAIVCILRWFHGLTEKAGHYRDSASRPADSTLNLPHPSSL